MCWEGGCGARGQGHRATAATHTLTHPAPGTGVHAHRYPKRTHHDSLTCLGGLRGAHIHTDTKMPQDTCTSDTRSQGHVLAHV